MEDKDNTPSSSSRSSAPSSSSIVPSSSLSYGYLSPIQRMIRLGNQPFFSESISKQVKAPFAELPLHISEFISRSNQSLSKKMDDLRMSLGFRFTPGQSNFITDELPESFEKLTLIKKSLGLYKSKQLLSLPLMFCFSKAGVGLRSLVTEQKCNNVLVEAITFFNGYYWRFIILSVMGVGCTVWYGFVPGLPNIPPYDCNLFAPFESYQPFFNTEFSPQGFSKLTLIESVDTKELSESVESAMESEPFTDLRIPANGPMLQRISLAILIASFMTLGVITTDFSSM